MGTSHMAFKLGKEGFVIEIHCHSKHL